MYNFYTIYHNFLNHRYVKVHCICLDEFINIFTNECLVTFSLKVWALKFFSHEKFQIPTAWGLIWFKKIFMRKFGLACPVVFIRFSHLPRLRKARQKFRLCISGRDVLKMRRNCKVFKPDKLFKQKFKPQQGAEVNIKFGLSRLD